MPERTPTRNPAGGLPGLAFRDLHRAEQNFDEIRGRVPAAVADAIPALLADVPDPDTALNYFERLTESAGSELFGQLEKHRSLIHYALMVFGYSQYLGETLLHNTDILPALLRDANLDRSRSREDFREAFARFRSRSFAADIAQRLARFKRREYVRIMLRDMLGLAALSEASGEISALSDVLIEEALRECESAMHAKVGMPLRRDAQGKWVPAPFAVLALGKLGGNELNYSSDVDLMFLYGQGEGDPRAAISNREYFVRLGQQVTDVLSRVTKEGFVFRIDLRLRPQGREGESAISAEQALRYYSQDAHDWERQALIKVRYCAGDAQLARQFVREVQEHVYTERVNFAAIETALKTRDRMRDRRKLARREGIDVKLDAGGIRDIEFLVQCLQRVYGGKEKWLRSGGTLFSLQKLHDKQHISGSDFHLLTTAYEFLRTVEHRLQLRRGQQTHRIPTDPVELAVFARSLRDQTTAPENVEAIIRERMEQVSAIYQRIIHHQQQQTEEQVSQEFELRTLDLSFGRVHSDRQILHRLAAENPALHDIAARQDLEAHTRRNLFRFLSSALTDAGRYAPLAAAPELLEKAMPLFRQSEFLTDMLIRHPEDIANIAELRPSSPRHQPERLFDYDDLIRSSHSSALDAYLSSAAMTRGEKLTLLRRRYRYRIFMSGAHDVIAARPVFASLSDTTAAAEEAIASAFAIVGVEGLSALALGRLGTREFDCLSDADLLFVRDDSLDPDSAARAVEEVMQVLSAYTHEGTALAVDVRLRPHGTDGALTVTADQLARYFETEAEAWEALTYTKLRFIAGDRALGEQSATAMDTMYVRFRTAPSFASEVRRMRAKLENSAEPHNMKTGLGGLYDIDFIVGSLLIRNGMRTAAGNTRQRLQTLGQAGLVDRADLQVLLAGLEFWRTLEHLTRLASGKAQKTVPLSETARQSVTELLERLSAPDVAEDLECRAAETRSAVRGVFERVISPPVLDRSR